MSWRNYIWQYLLLGAVWQVQILALPLVGDAWSAGSLTISQGISDQFRGFEWEMHREFWTPSTYPKANDSCRAVASLPFSQFQRPPKWCRTHLLSVGMEYTVLHAWKNRMNTEQWRWYLLQSSGNIRSVWNILIQWEEQGYLYLFPLWWHYEIVLLLKKLSQCLISKSKYKNVWLQILTSEIWRKSNALYNNEKSS